jgi:hypothetical protein
MEAELVADHADALVCAREFDELFGSIEGASDGFFEEDVAAREEAGAGYGDVKAAGVTNVGDLGLLGESFFKVVEGSDVVHILDILLLIGRHGWGNDVGETADAIGNDFNRITEQSAKIACMALTDATETDDENFHESS